MTRAEAITRLRAKTSALREAGVRGLSLFGSTARDEAGPESDIDVLVDVDLDAYPDFDLLALIRVQYSIEDALGIPVHALLDRRLHDGLRASIARDAIPIF